MACFHNHYMISLKIKGHVLNRLKIPRILVHTLENNGLFPWETKSCVYRKLLTKKLKMAIFWKCSQDHFRNSLYNLGKAVCKKGVVRCAATACLRH